MPLWSRGKNLITGAFYLLQNMEHQYMKRNKPVSFCVVQAYFLSTDGKVEYNKTIRVSRNG